MKNVIILFVIIFNIIALNAQTKKQKQQEEREIDSIFITNVAEYVHCNIYGAGKENSYFSTRRSNIDSIMFYKAGTCVSFHIAFTYFVLSEIKNSPNIKIFAVDGPIKPEYYYGNSEVHRITLVEFYGTKYYFDVGWKVYWSKTLPRHMKGNITMFREDYSSLKYFKMTDAEVKETIKKCNGF